MVGSQLFPTPSHPRRKKHLERVEPGPLAPQAATLTTSSLLLVRNLPYAVPNISRTSGFHNLKAPDIFPQSSVALVFC